jgi:hypothetical protein
VEYAFRRAYSSPISICTLAPEVHLSLTSVAEAEILRGSQLPERREPPKITPAQFKSTTTGTHRSGSVCFTRLTNGFSKKLDNHAYAVALHFMYCNFVRIHGTPRVSPAVEAGLTEHVWAKNW